MKTRFLPLLSLGIFLLLPACKTESFEETQTDFQKELTSLSTKKNRIVLHDQKRHIGIQRDCLP